MIKWLSNLRVRFLGLALVAVLPALGLLIVSANEQRDRAIADAQAGAERVVNLAAANQGRVIASTRQLLVVLSRLPEIRDAGPACDGLLKQLHAQFPEYANLGVVARDGEVVCSAVPLTGTVNLGGERFVQGVITTADFTVSQYQTSPETDRQVIDAGYPVFDDGTNLVAVVYASIDLERLAADYVAPAQIAEGEIVTVFDSNGTALLRLPPQDAFVGRSLLATPVVATVLADVDGAGVADQADGAETYLYAYAPLGDAAAPSAYLSIAVPRAEVVRDADEAFSANLTRLGLVVVAILIGTWVGADLLIRRNTDTYKLLVRHIYDAFGSGGVDLLDEAVADDFRDHDPMPGQAEGLAGLKQAVGLFRAAFPDGEMLVDDMVAEGDKVVTRVTLRGTQRGAFFGVPGTGRIVSAEGIEIYRIDKGKIVEGWSRFVPPLLEEDDDEPEPAATLDPTLHPPDLTVGSVARALGRGLRKRLPSGGS